MEAADGAEALGVLARWPAALILTDLQMPRMSGLGMVQKLRESGDQTPVIMMSGLSDVGQSVALGAGVDVYLPKPVDPARLVAAIDRLLSPAASAHRIPA
jgi:DNA-binding response OmpR family regulator